MEYANRDKLSRAKIWAKAQGKENDEQTIHDRYVAIGGLVIQDDESVEKEAEEEGAKPKKPKKPKKGE